MALPGFTGLELMHTLLNIHRADHADNLLHLVSGVAALYFGMTGSSRLFMSPHTDLPGHGPHDYHWEGPTEKAVAEHRSSQWVRM